MSKIEQLISEIEMYLDSCKIQSFSGGKRIVVEKDIIDEMLAELRMQTPEEIRTYQKIITNKDAILADAQSKADFRTKMNIALKEAKETDYWIELLYKKLHGEVSFVG